MAAKLAGLDTNERHKLYKRASMLRKTTRKNGRSNRPGQDWDEDDAPAPRRKPAASLEDLVLKILEQEDPALPSRNGARQEATVVWVGPKLCRVQVGSEELTCEICPDLARRQQTAVAVGDVAVLERGDDLSIVRGVLPRRSQLSRPDPDNAHRERVIAANIDLVVVTVSIKSPPLHPRLIDRYLVAIQHGGAQAALCVNKLDLATSGAERREELEKLAPYAAAGVSIVGCSTVDHEGMEELRGLISGRTCAFVGHSGVGKSSVLNVLNPELALETAAVSEGYGRGRHTTTASSLFDLGGGTRLIDTPGIRSFGLWQMTAQELARYFPEFEAHSDLCRFRDCSHRHEPNCGVKRAVAEQQVSGYRYETYLRLVEEV